jgi:methylated-DNA-[protein]-cysteine S-methyltransferase
MFKKRTIATVIGKLVLAGQDEVIEYIQFGSGPLPARFKAAREDSSAFSVAVTQLGEYFAGSRETFTFPILLTSEGFQRKALLALRKVGFGKTVSYKELAARAGSASASRAAGTACARNPLPIVIPCHRVLKADGSLGGFGGGLDVKMKLLDLEHADYRK